MAIYYRPLVQTGPVRPVDAHPVAGGACWFTHAQTITRTGGAESGAEIVPAADIPQAVMDRITQARQPIAGLALDSPLIMGILNVTPDSFSDGGDHNGPAKALAFGRQMVLDGADIIDVGGESTRPGALEVPQEAEIARTFPVVSALRNTLKTPISIDTRKASVARAIHGAGADIVNDVSGFTFDKALAPYCAEHGLPVCVMHAQGDPETMHVNPRYDNVLLDVYDFLEAQLVMLGELGIPRSRIMLDPGIGFGKTIAHNLALLNGISLFHSLGCAILLGVSRKGFIREIGAAPVPAERAPGSIAVGLAALAQGVQILRVHDVKETRQALNLWQAVMTGEYQ
ncbi:MAG: dihydropteroate synthase [Rhodobacterales bacterium]|nr:MAG: dihydropteroate synthase [Rhodobacterales bacterium]